MGISRLTQHRKYKSIPSQLYIAIHFFSFRLKKKRSEPRRHIYHTDECVFLEDWFFWNHPLRAYTYIRVYMALGMCVYFINLFIINKTMIAHLMNASTLYIWLRRLRCMVCASYTKRHLHVNSCELLY